ncbi:Hypothetical protein, predicted lipoprotein [Mycoplasmopsis bovigenitalium 51080]|uniref:Lipoprotein n=1 Tax=Mycoplasmopsis bovigenitalium 51080 TaxID=1188235 RepID=N9TW03_9BACT|nr:hypothetical protein [Mycoplasmopsis bovigenitalium]ENY70210.1 Hypothetical protein, predicted lipoprotein [Mycoplasmopsis bovigenitalium 51080]
MKFKKLLNSLFVIAMPLALSACGKINAENEYQAFKTQVNLANQKFAQINKEYVHQDKKDQFILIQNYFLNDLIIYKNNLKNNQQQSSNFQSRVNESLIKIKNILTNNDAINFDEEKAKFDSLSSEVKLQIEEYNKNFKQLYYAVKSIYEKFSHFAQKALKIKSSSIIKKINKDLEKLKTFLAKEKNEKVLEKIYLDSNKIGLIKEQSKKIIGDLQTKITKLDLNYYHNLIDKINQISNINFESNIISYSDKNILSIEIDFIHLMYIRYLTNSIEKPIENENNFKINIDEINSVIDTVYPIKNEYYKIVFSQYLELVNLIDKLGPNSSEQINNKHLKNQANLWAQNFKITFEKFLSWEQKINNKELINYNDNFQDNLAYNQRLNPKQIIFTNTFNFIKDRVE